MPTFPTVELLDNFNRSENPLNNGGKWKGLFEAQTEAYADGAHARWNSSGNGQVVNEQSASYWTPTSFESEPGAAATPGSENNRPVCLFICLQNPATELSGYQLVAEIEGGSSKIGYFRINKYVKGTRTQLKESGSFSFTPEVDKIGLSVAEGKVLAWLKKGAGAWEVKAEGTDSTYTKGFIGLGGCGTSGSNWLDDFEGGEHVGPPTVNKPEDQHSTVNKSANLQITGTNIHAYKATGLPTGLSINESTGKITGTPTVIEATKVKVKVENVLKETAETEFEWTIEEAPPRDVFDMIIG